MTRELTLRMSDVLIVDDEAPIRQVLSRFVALAGHKTRVAASAAEALDCIADSAPAVALCDVHMPGANGLWLADEIRRLSPTTAIVLVTGDHDIPPVESLRKGVVAYVLKPVERQELVKAVALGLHWSVLERQHSAVRAYAEREPQLALMAG
jgi:two-component system, NtrC family, C4-dicarboxylate transport response regulator DctD